MPLIRTELTAESRDEARHLVALYQRGGNDKRREDEVLGDIFRRGATPRGRPRLAGTSNANPPVLFFDTDVYLDTQG